jgi:hypothetical protein
MTADLLRRLSARKRVRLRNVKYDSSFEGADQPEPRREEMSIGHLTRTLKWSALDGPALVRLLIFALPFQVANAQDSSVLGDFWAAYGMVNYSSWDGLGDVQPVGRGGPFETSGVGIDLGGYTSVARLDSFWLLVGGELGLLGLNSNVIFEQDSGSGTTESAFEVNHITALLKARFGKPGGRYLDLSVGLGQYYSDTKYIDCSVIINCFSADTGNSATGAFLELSGTPGRGFLVGARVHFVEFDPIEAVDLGVSKLKGPIYSVFVGWEYGNWRRK